MKDEVKTDLGIEIVYSNGLVAKRTADGLVLERARPVTLIMFSSGVDSTYLLAKFLKETDDEILVHHVHLLNAEGRHLAEARQCRAIIEYCRTHYRPFRYTESAIDHRGLAFFGYDMIAIGFEAGIVAHGFLLENNRRVTRWLAGHCTEDGSNPERLVHVLACVAANCFPGEPPEFFKHTTIRKAEEYRYLDPGLRDLVWTCRMPVKTETGFKECSTCKTCEMMAEVRRECVEVVASPP